MYPLYHYILNLNGNMYINILTHSKSLYSLILYYHSSVLIIVLITYLNNILHLFFKKKKKKYKYIII